jgi:hypothetical protein
LSHSLNAGPARMASWPGSKGTAFIEMAIGSPHEVGAQSVVDVLG